MTDLGMHQDSTAFGVGIIKERSSDGVHSFATEHGPTALQTLVIGASAGTSSGLTGLPQTLASTVARLGNKTLIGGQTSAFGLFRSAFVVLPLQYW